MSKESIPCLYYPVKMNENFDGDSYVYVDLRDMNEHETFENDNAQLFIFRTDYGVRPNNHWTLYGREGYDVRKWNELSIPDIH